MKTFFIIILSFLLLKLILNLIGTYQYNRLLKRFVAFNKEVKLEASLKDMLLLLICMPRGSITGTTTSILSIKANWFFICNGFSNKETNNEVLQDEIEQINKLSFEQQHELSKLLEGFLSNATLFDGTVILWVLASVSSGIFRIYRKIYRSGRIASAVIRDIKMVQMQKNIIDDKMRRFSH